MATQKLLLSFLILSALIACGNAMFPLNKRLYRSLPSVSNDHYQENNGDGTYKYAYTGDNRYTAERRLADGTVEGESLYVRPDGIPVKVHYFADARGYRPKTEVLYSERIVAARTGSRKVIVPDVIYKEVDVEHAPPPPTLYLAPPEKVREIPVPVAVPVPVPVAIPQLRTVEDSGINVRLEGSTINVGNNNGGDTAVASPSVTAIVGPGGHAELRPEGIARAGRGGTAISNPVTNAVVGPGGSVVLAPSARASTVPEIGDPIDTVIVRSSDSIRHGGHVYHPHPQPEVIHRIVPAPQVIVPHPPPQVRTVVPVPVPAVHTSDVVIVPPRSSYSYEYSYSAPDGKHPGAGDNKAFVAVRVNS